MIAGMHKSGHFCPIVFHNQIQSGEISTFVTSHTHVIEVVHKNGHTEFAFWDEAAMACPGGDTFEEAVEAFDRYCTEVLGP